jgi:hypothetical protein
MTKGRLADVLIMSVVGLGRVIGDWVEPAASPAMSAMPR